jgi:biopolymer transport protein ExbD
MKQSQQAVFNDINITPLTDIFLVLLIIMMVVAPMLDFRGLDMGLTTSESSGQHQEKGKFVVVNIAADGRFSVNGTMAAPDELAKVIHDENEKNPDGIIIEANPESSHGDLTQAIESAQASGATSVSVVEAEPEAPAAPAKSGKGK